MATQEHEFERAREALLKVVQESSGHYSPGQVLDEARKSDMRNVSESMLRLAMWRLLNEHKIELSSDLKVSARRS